MKKILVLLMAAALLFSLNFGVMAFDDCDPEDIVDTLVGTANFYRIVEAVTAAGLVEALQGEGPFTLFAPTDEAFAALPEGVLAGLLEDPEALAQILLLHVIAGEFAAAQVVELDGAEVETLLGQNITIRIEGESVFVNEAQVIATDWFATNGVIHTINAVLIPEL